MNCHSCIHSVKCPEDEHLSCSSGNNICSTKPENITSAFVEFIKNFENIKYAILKQNIKINQHGYDKGWACWPINFDPVWIENCNNYKGREIE